MAGYVATVMYGLMDQEMFAMFEAFFSSSYRHEISMGMFHVQSLVAKVAFKEKKKVKFWQLCPHLTIS